MNKPPTLGEMKWRLEIEIYRRGFKDCEDLYAAQRALYKGDHSGIMVYAIREGKDGPVKIGETTGDPRQRLATLQCGNSAEMYGWAAWDALPGEEKFLHALFAEHHIRGEWFQPDEVILTLTAREGGTFFDPHAFDLDPAYEEDMAR